MKVSFEGMGERVATFEAVTAGNTAVVPGGMVTLAGNGKVCACTASGDVPAGVALDVRDGLAAVQIGGYVKLPCASAMTVGYHHLASDSSGKAVETSGGRCAIVTDVADGVCGAIL